MRLMIEIVAAVLLVVCITATSAAFAAGKTGRTADGLSCAFSVPQERLARRALRRDQAAMRRKVLGELLRRQDAVGDVSEADPAVAATTAGPGERRAATHKCQSRVR